MTRGLEGGITVPIDISARVAVKAQAEVKEQGSEVVVVPDLSGKTAIVTVIGPRLVARKSPDKPDPFPPAA